MKQTASRRIRRAGKTLTALVLAFALIAGPGYPAAPEAEAASLSDLQQKQKELKEKQAENQEKLDQLKEDASKQKEYKETLDAQIDNLEAQISGLNSQIAQMDSEIKEKNSEIADKQKSIDKNMELLKERLCALYMMGEASNLQLILSSDNVMDMAEKTEIIRMISEHDTALVQELSAEMESISEQKKAIEENRGKVASAKTELDAKQGELNELQEEANRVLQELQAKESSVQKEQDKLDKEMAAAEAAIDQWFLEQAAQEQQKPSGGGSSGGNSGGNSGGSGGSGGASYEGTGSFIWPTPGYTNLTDYFGARGGTHKGIDISSYGIFGKPIVASDSGTVTFAQYGMPGSGYGGYGNVVVINHGNGYMTLYAHCNSLAVSAGQSVKKGQTIAYVGSTGDSTGPHLHFEIRVNGIAQNPMNWFR